MGPFFYSLFRHCFDAAGADLFLLAADFLDLEIDAEFAESLDIGMADFVAGLGAALADGTYFTHTNKFMVA